MARPNHDIRQNLWLAGLSGMVLVMLVIICVFVVQPPVVVPQGPAADPVAVGDDGAGVFGGWVDDANAREAVKQSLPVGQVYFGDTPAGKSVRGDDTKDVLLTDAERDALGHWVPIRDQKDVGSCVSFGTAGAIETLFCIQMVNARNAGQPPPTEFKDLCQEAIYGGSRVEVGGGRIRGDGSVTAWAADFVRKWGVLPRGKYGSLDLMAYDTRRCREWGQKGLPDDLEPEARKSPVKGITFVRTADEAWKAIGQGYPIAIGSQVGFGDRGPWPRDRNGFLRASGSWGHCMSVVGRATVDGRKAFLFRNSWGPGVHQGPKGGKNIPDSGCFFVEYATMNRMCGEGDALAFSDAVGFPARQLPEFFIKAPARPAADGVFALAW